MKKPVVRTRKVPRKQTLKERAEKFIVKHPEVIRKMPSRSLKGLMHELQVHQVELEMQNEELRDKQVELAGSLERYADLYDFAPVGYFLFNKKGRITAVNLTGAGLLGVERSTAMGRPFTAFLHKDSIPRFLRHVMEVFSDGNKQTCELLVNAGRSKARRYVMLESVVLGARDGARLRSAVIDVTERKLAEEETLRAQKELAEAHEQLEVLSERLLEFQEEERKRVAYEVHDGLASSLAAIRLKLSSALSIPEDSRAAVIAEALDQMQTLMKEALRIQSSLLPSTLGDLGLIPALNSICRTFSRNNPKIALERELGTQENSVPGPIKLQIFRIAEEALNNIAKHAVADSARISLTKGNSSIELVIADRGPGFDAKKAFAGRKSAKGLGLSSMRQRAALSGGAFRIESTPGKGTTIRVSWPLT